MGRLTKHQWLTLGLLLLLLSMAVCIILLFCFKGDRARTLSETEVKGAVYDEILQITVYDPGRPQKPYVTKDQRDFDEFRSIFDSAVFFEKVRKVISIDNIMVVVDTAEHSYYFMPVSNEVLCCGVDETSYHYKINFMQRFGRITYELLLRLRGAA